MGVYTIETSNPTSDSGPLHPSGRTYTREPEVAAQICRLAALPPHAVLAEIERDQLLPNRVLEETLVALCRMFARKGLNEVAWQIAGVLSGRVKNRLAHQLRFWRLDRPQSIAADVADEVIAAMYAAVFDQDRKSLFWEIRFWVAFDRRVLNAVRTKRMEIDRTSQMVLAGESDEEDAGTGAVVVRDTETGRAGLVDDPLTNLLIADALAGLPEPVRTAYVLKHAANLPEDSRRADAPLTISAVLGVSGRTVRNYLRKAEDAVAQWRSAGDSGQEVEP